MVKTKRLRYLIFAFAVNILMGITYAWTNISGLINAEFEWGTVALSATITVRTLSTGLGAICSGILAKKFKPGQILFGAAILSFSGYMLSTFVIKWGLVPFNITYGLMAGCAAGLSGIVIMNTVVQWFPDKPGLIIGIMQMGMGVGTLTIGTAVSYIAQLISWRFAIRTAAVATIIVWMVASFILRLPNENDVLPPAVETKNKKAVQERKNYTTKEMLCRPSFYMFYVWAILGCMLNTVVVGFARQISDEVLMPVTLATLAAGIINICCSVGAVSLGFFYDKLGRKRTMLIENLCLVLGCAGLAVSVKFSIIPLVMLSFIMMGFAFGGLPTTNSAYTREFYGDKYFAGNYSVMDTRNILASFGAPLVSSLQLVFGSYVGVFGILTVVMLCSFGLSVCIRKP